VRSREANFWTCFPRDRINAGAPSTARAEPKRALGRRLEVREIQLKNNKLPLSAAVDRVIHDSTSQNNWPVIFAESLTDRIGNEKSPRRPESRVLLVGWGPRRCSRSLGRFQVFIRQSRQNLVWMSELPCSRQLTLNSRIAHHLRDKSDSATQS
jgi:hypothetical protein